MGARRKARELALQMLFRYDMSGNPPDTVIATFEDLEKSKANTREFATKIFRGTVDHMPKIDEMIQAQADNWCLSRMAVVDRIALKNAISQLPNGYRRVFILHDVEGFEHEEVARIMGISVGTSKSQLHKARLKLRGLLLRENE